MLGTAWATTQDASAQAIGFQPGISSIPDGVALNATPVVSADRRYVRIGLAPQFQTLRGVNSFSFPGGAVSGGGSGGGFGGGGAGGGLFAARVAPTAGDKGPAIVPRQVKQVVANQGGAAVIPGLAAVGPWQGFTPGFGFYPPAYGYGYGYPNSGMDPFGYSPFGFGGYGPPLNNPWLYNPYNDPYVQPMLLPQGMLFIPRNPTVNNLGGVMDGIMRTVGPR
jgi:hypothetical protein